MPYSIKRKGDCYEVYNRETGEVKAECTTMANAMSQVRLLHGVSHGMVARRNPAGDQWFVVQFYEGDLVDLVGPFAGKVAADQFVAKILKALGSLQAGGGQDDEFEVRRLKSPRVFMGELDHLMIEDVEEMMNEEE